MFSGQKEFKELPHRKAILEVRAKKDEVLKRKVQVQDMLDEAEGKLAAFVQEDELLSAKQDEITETLSRVQGDYRAVTAHTRDLDGVRKRRREKGVANSPRGREWTIGHEADHAGSCRS